jgi:hypothetical protein
MKMDERDLMQFVLIGLAMLLLVILYQRFLSHLIKYSQPFSLRQYLLASLNEALYVVRRSPWLLGFPLLMLLPHFLFQLGMEAASLSRMKDLDIYYQLLLNREWGDWYYTMLSWMESALESMSQPGDDYITAIFLLGAGWVAWYWLRDVDKSKTLKVLLSWPFVLCYMTVVAGSLFWQLSLALSIIDDNESGVFVSLALVTLFAISSVVVGSVWQTWYLFWMKKAIANEKLPAKALFSEGMIYFPSMFCLNIFSLGLYILHSYPFFAFTYVEGIELGVKEIVLSPLFKLPFKVIQALLFPLPLLIVLGHGLIGSIKYGLLLLKRFPVLIVGLYVLPLFTFLFIQIIGHLLQYGFHMAWRFASGSEGTIAFFMSQNVLADIVSLLRVGVSVLLITMLLTLLMRIEELMGGGGEGVAPEGEVARQLEM